MATSRGSRRKQSAEATLPGAVPPASTLSAPPPLTAARAIEILGRLSELAAGFVKDARANPFVNHWARDYRFTADMVLVGNYLIMMGLAADARLLTDTFDLLEEKSGKLDRPGTIVAAAEIVRVAGDVSNSLRRREAILNRFVVAPLKMSSLDSAAGKLPGSVEASSDAATDTARDTAKDTQKKSPKKNRIADTAALAVIGAYNKKRSRKEATTLKGEAIAYVARTGTGSVGAILKRVYANKHLYKEALGKHKPK